MAIQDQTSALRRVFVRPPEATDAGTWHDYGWRSAPDPGRASDEHEAFRAHLEAAGATLVLADTPVPGDIDAIYAYDPTLLTDAGAVLLRTGKPGRRAEPGAMGLDLNAAGIEVLGTMQAPGTAEGGDMFWLDERTLLVGRGYRTNDEGIAQLGTFLEPLGADVVSFDLPHFHGESACMHLMSFISPLAPDLAVVFAPMVPVRLMEMLNDRAITLVQVPDEEFDSQGPNVLALAPRVALALDGNPETRRRMESVGVDVRTYAGSEISRKGDGGPTCLTRPLERG
ncbi:MAG TPA: arginine deiminase family protein [Actinomycetota bacterium]